MLLKEKTRGLERVEIDVELEKHMGTAKHARDLKKEVEGMGLQLVTRATASKLHDAGSKPLKPPADMERTRKEEGDRKAPSDLKTDAVGCKGAAKVEFAAQETSNWRNYAFGTVVRADGPD